MYNTHPSLLFYTKQHEWIAFYEDHAVVGISDHAQSQLGDVVYIDLPQINQKFNKDENCAVIESVKAASDIYSPVCGTIISCNMELTENPHWVNEDPYNKGYLFCMKPLRTEDKSLLMDHQAYEHFLKENS